MADQLEEQEQAFKVVVLQELLENGKSLLDTVLLLQTTTAIQAFWCKLYACIMFWSQTRVLGSILRRETSWGEIVNDLDE